MPSHAMGASLKHLVLITQYHGSSDSLSNKDEDEMDILSCLCVMCIRAEVGKSKCLYSGL